MLLLITLVVVIGDVFILFLSRTIALSTEDTYANLSDSWYPAGNYGIADEPISHTIDLKKYSSYFVHINIPNDFPIKSRSCITFTSYACAFDVIVDGRIIYSYGKDRLRQKKMIPRKTHYVCIPEDAADRDVRISFVAGRDGGSVLTDGSYFGEIDVLARVFTIKRGYAFIICAFFISFGTLLILLAVLTGKLRIQITGPTIAQALLLIDLGVYISCYNDTMSYFFRDDVGCTFVEYVSLFALPFFMQVVIITNRANHVRPWHWAITAFDIFVVILAVILHLTDTIHLTTMNNYIHIFMGAHGVYTVLWLRYVNLRERKTSRSYLYADAAMETVDYGILGLLILSLINLVLWNMGIYRLDVLNSDVKGNFIILGALVFSSCVILSYLYHSLGITHEDEIKKSLTNAAYTDELTGLNNRAYCDILIGSRDHGDWKGSLIFLDLDGLKLINDTGGHEAGDRYIKAFASTIRSVFPDEVIICRMGGDEFLVIIQDVDSAACKKAAEDIDVAVNTYNAENRDTPILYSVGMSSYDSDNTLNPMELFRLADERMYIMKDEHHKQGKGGRV
ncbi:MAG: GGDEF domain-containing protein [Lachnospiraceae bacterium]|nr:GGDEF domain-containing protein [Lachnospiraceae bacterium]